jgi:hypothetical protein
MTVGGVLPLFGQIAYNVERAAQVSPEEAERKSNIVTSVLEKPFGKLFGVTENPAYKGELHTTQKDYDNMPKEIKVSKADGTGWKTDDYSGKEEVTTNKEIKNTSSDVVNTRDLLNKQYKVIIHPNVQSIKKHIEQVGKDNPELSILNQL